MIKDIEDFKPKLQTSKDLKHLETLKTFFSELQL